MSLVCDGEGEEREKAIKDDILANYIVHLVGFDRILQQQKYTKKLW